MNKYLYSISLLLILALSACTAGTSTSPAQTAISESLLRTPTPTPTSTHSISLTITTPTIAPSPTANPSYTPQNTATPRVYATITRLPSLTPTLTPTPTLIPTLDSSQLLQPRNPSLEEIKTYLFNLPTEYFHSIHDDLEYVADQVSTFKNYRGFSEALQLTYEDVNGDQQDDLIVTDVLLTGIFLWGNSEYLTPFVMLGSEWKYSPASHTSFADWTGDSTPEVIFDYRSDSGGTGVSYSGWETFVIHCDHTECIVIWNGGLTSLYSDYNLGGLTLFQSTLNRYTEDGQLLLERNRSHFSIYDSYYWPPESYWDVPLEALKVYTSTQEIYIWDGSMFTLIETNVIRQPYIITGTATFEATHELDRATITFENNHLADANNDFCQLILNEEPIGEYFGCKRNFTTVEWRDITGDGQPDIVIRAFSGARPSALKGTWPEVEDWLLLSDIDCAHQHLLAYQWNGLTARKIADVEGCVVQDDLYGVRLTDLDSDGQVEIMAANQWFTEEECIGTIRFSCWYEFGYANNIFKWNGLEFVLTDTVPNEPEQGNE